MVILTHPEAGCLNIGRIRKFLALFQTMRNLLQTFARNTVRNFFSLRATLEVVYEKSEYVKELH